MTFQDKLKSTSVDVDYFSLARYKAERAAIRKERNYLEFSGGIQGSLTSYNDPWIRSRAVTTHCPDGGFQGCATSSRRTSSRSKPSSMPSWAITG